MGRNGKYSTRLNLFNLKIDWQVSVYKIATSFRRMLASLAEQPRRLLYFPLAIPIALSSIVLFLSGVALSLLHPEFLRSRYAKY
jgi:hypothetical protein